jgi:hypothetical protein
MPVFPEFEVRAVEIPENKGLIGHVAYKDEEWVKLRVDPKTVSEYRVKDVMPLWQRRATPRNDDTDIDRENIEQAQYFIKCHEAWKKGEELAVDGLDIRKWPLISLAQCKSAQKQGILSVEQMATAEENVLQYIPQGRKLKQEAQAYLEASKDTGKVAAQTAELRVENDELKRQMDQMRREVSDLLAAQAKTTAQAAETEITEPDIANEPPLPKKRGRPKKKVIAPDD